jgi:hypothetical protein
MVRCGAFYAGALVNAGAREWKGASRAVVAEKYTWTDMNSISFFIIQSPHLTPHGLSLAQAGRRPRCPAPSSPAPPGIPLDLAHTSTWSASTSTKPCSSRTW